MVLRVSIESARGCGFRKVGGLYLVAEGLSAPCGKLPIPLEVCPTCSAGVKPARGWTWLDGDRFTDRACQMEFCRNWCPMRQRVGRVGLLWIGEKFYPTPEAWMEEAGKMGISRRIATVPLEFELGKTWVWVAHRKAIPGGIVGGEHEWTPAVIHAFKPLRIEVIVSGEETEEEINKLEKRGLTPVQVIPEGEYSPLYDPKPTEEVFE